MWCVLHCSLLTATIDLSIHFLLCNVFFLQTFFRIFVWFAYECGANTNFIPLSAFTTNEEKNQHQKRNENIIRTKSHRGIFYAILSDEIMDLSGPFNKKQDKSRVFFSQPLSFSQCNIYRKTFKHSMCNYGPLSNSIAANETEKRQKKIKKKSGAQTWQILKVIWNSVCSFDLSFVLAGWWCVCAIP